MAFCGGSGKVSRDGFDIDSLLLPDDGGHSDDLLRVGFLSDPYRLSTVHPSLINGTSTVKSSTSTNNGFYKDLGRFHSLPSVPLAYLLHAELVLTTHALPINLHCFAGTIGIIIQADELAGQVSILLSNNKTISLPAANVRSLLPVVPQVGDTVRVIGNLYAGSEGRVVSYQSSSCFIIQLFANGLIVPVGIGDMVRLNAAYTCIVNHPTPPPSRLASFSPEDHNTSHLNTSSLCSPSSESFTHNTPSPIEPCTNFCTVPSSNNFEHFTATNDCDFTRNILPELSPSHYTYITTSPHPTTLGLPDYTTYHNFLPQSYSGNIVAPAPLTLSPSYVNSPPSYWSHVSNCILTRSTRCDTQSKPHSVSTSNLRDNSRKSCSLLSTPSSSQCNPVQELKGLLVKAASGCPDKKSLNGDKLSKLISNALDNIMGKDPPDDWYCPNSSMHNNYCSDDLTTRSVSVSAMCPLTKQRMEYPSRGLFCNHLQCFDAKAYLQLAVKRCTKNSTGLKCPLCNKTINPKQLYIEKYFKKVLDTTDSNEVQYLGKKQWQPVEKISTPSLTSVIDLTEDSDDDL
jgi:E3 SUMO-protein ligase PIAS1